MSTCPPLQAVPRFVSASPVGKHPASPWPEVGSWKLAAGAALSLHPRRAGCLRLAAGRVWVTLGGPYAGHGNERGDLFLQAGESVAVPAGARLVVESVQAPAMGPARFDWSEHAEAKVGVGARPSRFQSQVVCPARDLVQALAQAGGALLRLFGGVFGYGEYLMAGRGRVLPHWESNP
ncbi:DUF2917 domain-containing protein, partial [Hydrogenophaga sp.]|uniref:DUF2917 domain-containing protein n=1 Tax=Hydrogenophaga sp. TaxID=1904254 RepID=UPI0035632298